MVLNKFENKSNFIDYRIENRQQLRKGPQWIRDLPIYVIIIIFPPKSPMNWIYALIYLICKCGGVNRERQ